MGLENFDVMMAQLVDELSVEKDIASIQERLRSIFKGYLEEDARVTHIAIGQSQTLDIPLSFYRLLSDSQKVLLMSILQNAARLIQIHSDSHLESLVHEVQAQNHLKDQLFTILAHDLRGPIGTARNILALVCEDQSAMTTEELKITLPEILISVESSYNLLENLLYWVRSQMQEISVLRERISVQTIIKNLVGWLDKTILAKGLGLDINCSKELSFDTDSRMVETILRNFLSNAIKFSKKSGVISLEAKYDSERSEVRISVADQGIGMTPEQVQALFGSIVRGTSGTKGERGSGLGLLFSNDMAKKLGGRIEVESKPGEGSKFILVLPELVEGELSPEI